jgi:hypothetical protein
MINFILFYFFIQCNKSSNSLSNLLSGDFSKEVFEQVRKIIPKGKLSIFFSSTFTDSHIERNIIMEEILPEMQIQAKPFGIPVTFVDMRFGVKDENTKDHLTWIACAEQIKCCFEDSDGMFFMSLQGDKYGYRPLPKWIFQEIVDARLKDVQDDSLKSMFFEWYLLDENNIPPRYSLKPLFDKDDPVFWGKALPSLRELLGEIQFDSASSYDIKVGHSVTEYEFLYAMQLSPSRSAWFKRTFESEITTSQDTKGEYCDFLNDSATAMKHKHLIDQMTALIPPDAVHSMTAPALKSYMEKDNRLEGYRIQFRNAMKAILNKELETVVEKTRLWNETGNGLGLSGVDLNEMVHHCRVLEDKCRTFQGRLELINSCIDHIKGYHDHNISLYYHFLS